MNFEPLAERLLLSSRIRAGARRFRLAEIEIYWHSPNDHPDPFVHQHPVQLLDNRWYFHRQRNGYRSGSFKGLDWTFGDGTAFGGVLIRTVVDEANSALLINGPSLWVDELLRLTATKCVAELDAAIGSRLATDTSSPVVLESCSREDHTILRTARVGLTLKRATRADGPEVAYVLRRYRYLTEPRRIAKGKGYSAFALFVDGLDVPTVAERLGSPRATVQRWHDDWQSGTHLDIKSCLGVDLTPRRLAQLHGSVNRTG